MSDKIANILSLSICDTACWLYWSSANGKSVYMTQLMVWFTEI